MPKPLVKWIIGPVSNSGFDCLMFSICSFRKIYGDEFDYRICYNNLNKEQFIKLNNSGVDVYNANDFIKSVNWPRPRFGPIWKLFTPRLRIHAHELHLDNDVVIRKRIPKIDDFLTSNNTFLISEAIERKKGIFENKVNPGLKFNTGIFGMPPNYNFFNDLEKSIRNVSEWETWFDEQGLISYLIQNLNYILISTKEINVCYKDTLLGEYGEHWVGINSNNKYYWHQIYNRIKFHL